MDFKETVLKNRSYRRFYQDHPVSEETLMELVNLARNTGSARNAQPLRYILSSECEKNAAIFETLAWAGYLKDWPGPEENERPSAYIVILNDTAISGLPQVDAGIAIQTILLGAVKKSLGGCIFGSINRKELSRKFSISKQYEILYVLALGKPKEDVILEDIKSGESIKYYRDEKQAHHVPKRSLVDVIIG